MQNKPNKNMEQAGQSFTVIPHIAPIWCFPESMEEQLGMVTGLDKHIF